MLPLIVDLLSHLKLTTPLEDAVLLFVFYVSPAPFSVLVGRESDRAGSPGMLMAGGIACLGVGLVGFYLVIQNTTGTSVFIYSVLCTLLMGIGSSFYHPLGGSILQASFGKGTTGRALGVNGSMGSTARALYPPLFFAAAVMFTRTGSLGFFGLVGLGASLLIWTGLGRVVFRTPHGAGKAPSIRSTMTRPMAILLGVTFFRSAALGGIVAYIPIFLTTQRGLGVSSVLGAALAAAYAPAILGQPFFGALADRIDHRVVLAISAFGAAASIVGCVSTHGVLSVALLSLFGFFTYTGFPLLMSLASDYAQHRASALGNSIIWGLGDGVGTSFGPVLVYGLTLSDYDRLGYAYVVLATLVAISAVAALLMPKPPHRDES